MSPAGDPLRWGAAPGPADTATRLPWGEAGGAATVTEEGALPNRELRFMGLTHGTCDFGHQSKAGCVGCGKGWGGGEGWHRARSDGCASFRAGATLARAPSPLNGEHMQANANNVSRLLQPTAGPRAVGEADADAAEGEGVATNLREATGTPKATARVTRPAGAHRGKNRAKGRRFGSSAPWGTRV
jgi:hypothetical protein